MLVLQKVLIIEDREDLGIQIVEDFKANKVKVKHIRSIDELEKLLFKLTEYQMVILDWLLEGDTSDSAKVCLSLIRDACFIPVVVWTEEIEIFEGETDEVYKLFPQAYLRAFSKSKVGYKDLLKELQDCYSQTPLNFTQQFRKSIHKAVESSLYNLADHSVNDLVKGLKSLIKTGLNTTQVDMEHVIDVLLRLVGREVYNDDGFIPELRTIIENLKTENTNSDGEEELISPSIQDLHMYYQPRNDDPIIRTGDIVKINYENTLERAIVITPACDLAQPRKTMYLRLAVIHQAANRDERQGKKADKWVLIEHGQTNVVSLHEILVLKNETLSIHGNLESVMSYDNLFKTITGQDITIQRQKRLDDPYRADLLHHFVSHGGRIGVHEFKL